MRYYLPMLGLLVMAGCGQDAPKFEIIDDQGQVHELRFMEPPPQDKKKPKGKQPTTGPVMPDGTYSFEQPDSEGLGGWEGKCGQTALANFCDMRLKRKAYTPTSRSIDLNTRDWGPGVHPETLNNAARKLCGKGVRKFPRTGGGSKPIDSMKGCLPAMALLAWDSSSKSMHWVTVVFITKTKVYFNHWGRQESLSRAEFNKRWAFTRCDTFSQTALTAAFNCQQNTFICGT